MRTPEEALWSHSRPGDPADCWLWEGGTNGKNYGVVSWNGKRGYAHRLSHEVHIGHIPEGMFVDHTCHNADKTCPGGPTCQHRLCVNPAHLEAVTPQQNMLRSLNTIPWAHAQATACPQGHDYTPSNTRVYRGMRRCLACARIRSQVWRDAKRSA